MTIESIVAEATVQIEGSHAARERALASSRALTRQCANTIRSVHRGEFGEAEALLREATRLRPDYADAYANLGVLHVVQGRSADALPPLEKAVRLAPRKATAWRNYAEALGSAGRSADAVRAFRAALDVEPEDANALEGLAWILATAPDAAVRDGRAAVDLATRAAALTGDSMPNVLDTLAAAYAEIRRYAEAIGAAERALGLARSRGDSDLAQQIELRLDLYRRGQPYRERSANVTER